MVTNLAKRIAIACTLTPILLISCQSDNIEIPDKELYTREFVKQFGVVDPNQNWNSASRISASIAPDAVAGADLLEIYTAGPGNKDARLLASYPASTQAFEFDAPGNLSTVYVLAKRTDGRATYGTYSPVNDRKLTVAATGSRAIQKTPLPYSFNLSSNKSLGTFIAENAMWNSFTATDGNQIQITKPSESGNQHQDIVLKKYIPDLDANGDFQYEEWDPTAVKMKLGDVVSETEGFEVGSQQEKETDKLNQIRFTSEDNKGKSDGDQFELRVTYKTVDTSATKTDESGGTSKLETAIQIAGNDQIVNDPVNEWWHEIWPFEKLPESVSEQATATHTLSAGEANFFKTQNTITVQGENIIIYKLEFKILQSSTKPTVKIPDVFDLYGFSTSGVSDFDTFKAKGTYLGPNNTYDEVGYSCEDLISLVGLKTGVFSEEVSATGECNLVKYKDKLRPERGVEYVVTENNSEVSIDYFFGCASTFNSFGYFYYTDAEANDIATLLKKPKFLIMYNACPGSNILLQETEDGEWKQDSDLTTAEISDGTGDQPADNEGKDMGADESLPEEGSIVDGWDTRKWKHSMRYSSFVERAEKGEYDDDEKYAPHFRSANYRLVYYSPSQFDSNGKLKDGSVGTYQFPAGTHIAFFVIQSGQYLLDKDGNPVNPQNKIDHRRIAFSIPAMNGMIGNTINAGHSHNGSTSPSTMNSGTGTAEDWTAFVTYRWNGQLMMGVEDYYAESENGVNGGDHDMNDMLFRVNGEFNDPEPEPEMNEEKPAEMSWIIACEDLGGTYDFDFNDVVFGVTHVAGSDEARVTALASGGTLPVYLWSQYQQKTGEPAEVNGGYILTPTNTNGGEFHSWWGTDRPHHTIINATGWTGAGRSVRISVPKDFSLAAEDSHGKPTDGSMGGFKVMVHGTDGINEINAPDPEGDVAPQMFLVPETWKWPTERQHITGAYLKFLKWEDGWWKTPDGSAKGNVINHNWKATN